ncbi:Ig-like domain-containing protein [Geotalea uraniireducens]|uniref:Ig-like domain-containing protein n=1 Tax=Geotalea uraniireducens TaxID=351604 RepID=UPI0012ECFDD7|nr:hypothetical protein [Geotalea uraniireducens]
MNFTIQIPVAASKATILADGNDFATITATLPGSVPVGATINFAVSGDTAVLSSPTAQTTSGGSASVTVKSSTLGAAVVTATYLGSAGSANVTFIQPQFSVSASKGLALANNTDTITITTAFQAPVPADGSVVNFSTSGAASLSAASATTTGGIATVTVKSATAGRVTVRADLSGSSATASTDIKFIAQPTSMAVTIAMNPPITSLAALQFVLINDPGATYNNGSYKIINQAAEQITSEPVSSGNNLTLGVFSLTFFDTLATPIIQLSYNISSGLPGVQVSPTGIIAGTGMNATPVTPPLTPSNFLLAVKYNTDTF